MRTLTQRGKPPLGVTVQWGHPLAQRLARAYLLNERAGKPRPQPFFLDPTIASVPVWERDGLRFDGVDDVAWWAESVLSAPASFSVMVRFRSTGNGADQWMFSSASSGGGSLAIGVVLESGKVRAFVRNMAGAAMNIQSSANFNDGLPHTAVLSVLSSGGSSLYVDGRSVATGTAPDLSAIAADRTALAALHRSSSALFFPGTIECAYIWTGRMLTSHDAAALHSDPYMFVQPARRQMFNAASGGGVKPWLYRSHTRTLGAGFQRGAL